MHRRLGGGVVTVCVALCGAASLVWAAPSSAGYPPPFAPLPSGSPLHFQVYVSRQITNQRITGISCPTTAWCMAVDEGGFIIHDLDGSWSHPRQVDPGSSADKDAGSGSWSGVSCPMSGWCMAVGSDGYSIYSNGSWSAPAFTNGLGAGSGVSCTSPSFCAVAQEHGGASFDIAGRWTSTGNGLDNLDGSTPISCAGGASAPVFCMEVDGKGMYSETSNDTSWSTPRPIAAQAGADEANVSCLSASFCVAGFLEDNRPAMWNGTTWTSAVSWQPSNHEGTPAVSCTAPESCAVIDGNGGALYGVGGINWQAGQIFDRVGGPLSAVSCATRALVCQVADSDGYVFQISWTPPPGHG